MKSRITLFTFIVYKNLNFQKKINKSHIQAKMDRRRHKALGGFHSGGRPQSAAGRRRPQTADRTMTPVSMPGQAEGTRLL
jgi:hypothetical protein